MATVLAAELDKKRLRIVWALEESGGHRQLMDSLQIHFWMHPYHYLHSRLSPSLC